MALTNRDRGRLRRLQDTLIRYAEQLGYSETMRVSVAMPSHIVLASLREYIYPDYEAEVLAVRDRLKVRIDERTPTKRNTRQPKRRSI